MQWTRSIILVMSIFVLQGCSEKKQVSISRYEEILTVEDILSVVSFPGLLERHRSADTEKGIHLFFGKQGFSHPKSESPSLLIVRIEYLFPKEEELVKEMKDGEEIKGIGDLAWYKAQSQSGNLIFLVRDKDIVVKIYGRTDNSGVDLPCAVSKQDIIELARIAGDKLK